MMLDPLLKNLFDANSDIRLDELNMTYIVSIQILELLYDNLLSFQVKRIKGSKKVLVHLNIIHRY